MAFADWSTTAASNTNAATGVNFDEGQVPSTVNDSAREMMAQLRAVVPFALDRDVSQLEVVNTTTETTVYSFTVPGNMLGTNKCIRLTLIGDLLNNSGSDDRLEVRVKYGSTTVSTFDSYNVPTNATRKLQYLQSEIYSANAASSQIALSRHIHYNNSAGVAGENLSAVSDDFAYHNSVSEDSTADKTLSVTVKHSIASANASFICRIVLLELL